MQNTVIDRAQVRKVFEAYASDYDLNDPKIKLKVDHTYRVAAICDLIADSLKLSQEDKDTAWLCGMLHDIGRFEQVRIYHTFIDSRSRDHAEMSCEVLFGPVKSGGSIRCFFPEEDSDRDRMIDQAIAWHNKLNLPEGQDERTRMFCDILRDADKVDILKVNCETPRSQIYDMPEEEFRTSAITPAVFDDLMSHRTVNRANSKTGIDFILGHLSFVFGLVYPESVRQMRKQGFLDELLAFESENEETQVKMAFVRDEVRAYMEMRASE